MHDKGIAAGLRKLLVTENVRIYALAQGCGEPHCHVCARVFVVGDRAALREAAQAGRFAISVLCCVEHVATPLPEHEARRQRLLAEALLAAGNPEAPVESRGPTSTVSTYAHGPLWIEEKTA